MTSLGMYKLACFAAAAVVIAVCFGILIALIAREFDAWGADLRRRREDLDRRRRESGR